MFEAVEGNTYQRLCVLLDEHQARHRVTAHDVVGQCEAASVIRGIAFGQGARALACKVKGNGANQHVLAILAADQRADLASLTRHTGESKAPLASPAEVDAPVVYVFGAVPPFSFHPALWLVADPLPLERFPQIAPSVGCLSRSIILDTEDYLHIARSEIATFRRPS